MDVRTEKKTRMANEKTVNPTNLQIQTQNLSASSAHDVDCLLNTIRYGIQCRNVIHKNQHMQRCMIEANVSKAVVTCKIK